MERHIDPKTSNEILFYLEKDIIKEIETAIKYNYQAIKYIIGIVKERFEKTSQVKPPDDCCSYYYILKIPIVDYLNDEKLKVVKEKLLLLENKKIYSKDKSFYFRFILEESVIWSDMLVLTFCCFDNEND